MKRSALLRDPQTPETYHIVMRLQQGRTAHFQYSDPDMARSHYDQLRTVGVIGGVAIRDIRFEVR